ncbi:hypothetical protein ABMA27_001776 [Loxostege sticticalis]|uniref:Fibromodulin n=1 Tax=Loxostege sticticalis TaxID=481309 RepID=A0ABR3HZM9_LOXSC
MAVTLLWAVLWGLLATAATQLSLPSAQLLRMAPDRPQCSPVVGDRCVVSDYAGDEYFYTVNGQHHRIEFSEGGYYKAKCKAVALGDAAQPAFKRRKIFADVTLEGCAPPANTSYADALAALNITVTQRLILTGNHHGVFIQTELGIYLPWVKSYWMAPDGTIWYFSTVWFLFVSKKLSLFKGLPKDTRLTAASFAGLPPLQALELTHSSDSVIVLEEGVLEPLAALRRLLLVLVRPARLPPRLAKLRLRYTGLRALPKEALNVVELEVVEDDLTDMGGPFPRLDTLTLSAAVVSAPVAPALRRASISRWQDAAPNAWRDCDRLEVLSLTQAAARRLPAGFVASCGRLHTLELQMMQAEELPESFLFNASALTKFKAANWPLKTLPPDLFEYSPRLEEIDLSNNGLESLPSGLFAPVVSSLRKLSLARNKLTANDVRLTVAPLSALLELNLANNALGDLCPASSANVYSRSVSCLSGLKQLEKLMLSRTQAPRVCADWMHHMHSLKRLDLTYNRIEELQVPPDSATPNSILCDYVSIIHT